MIRRFLTAALVLLLAGPAFAEVTAEQVAPLGGVAIQQGGRLKPLDTFARETVRQVTGKERFQRQEPVLTILAWIASPEETLKAPVIEVRNIELKKSLGLEPEGRWYSFRQIAESPAIQEIQKNLMARQQSGEKLSSLETEQSELLGKMHTLQGLLSGELFTVVPDPHDLAHPWVTPMQVGPPVYDAEKGEQVHGAFRDLAEAARAGDGEKLRQAGETLAGLLSSLGPYPAVADLEREMAYNRLHPFQKAWWLYLAGLLLLLGAGLSQGNLLYRLGIVLTLAGFAMHAYGFWLRCMIADRPPVTNMYESVIWVTFGAVLFALILEAVHRGRSFLLAATSTAIVGLVLADNLPAVLDPSIQPLTPVLRNNFWLTVHVLTITLGYAAFLLALGLGHMTLWQYLKGPENKDRIKHLNLYLYRSLQIGVLFLAAGTILGGVWANYSWGRFWGWDPKEVWALIALLGYLALLHGRYAGWLRDFGLAAGSILAFMGVMMAWYGVNFVLGAGLHSYGFGTGGTGYVGLYVALEVLFVAFVTWRYKQQPAAR